jgi:hypothetical protein
MESVYRSRLLRIRFSADLTMYWFPVSLKDSKFSENFKKIQNDKIFKTFSENFKILIWDEVPTMVEIAIF